MTKRHLAACCIVALALGAIFVMETGRIAPLPPDPSQFTLKGKFQGPTAAEDAIALSGLCCELAECLLWDGQQDEPRIKSGAAIEDLRVASREARMRGQSIGARQPKVKDAVQAYLDASAGNAGGPLTSEARAAWVAAFREVGRAAADATK
jgi:hypothetical protein